GGGRNARLDNFQRAMVWAGRRGESMRSRGGQDKGQRVELVQFIEASRTGAPMPIPFESLVATTGATIAVTESLVSGRPEKVGLPFSRIRASAGMHAGPARCHLPRWPGVPVIRR